MLAINLRALMYPNYRARPTRSVPNYDLLHRDWRRIQFLRSSLAKFALFDVGIKILTQKPIKIIQNINKFSTTSGAKVSANWSLWPREF